MLKRQLMALLLCIFSVQAYNLELSQEEASAILDESQANSEQVLRNLKNKIYANLFVCNTLKTRNLNVTGTATFHDLQILGSVNNQPTKILYVDKNSTAPGTPDGSFYNPYLTIQAAIDAISARGDNGTNPYRIEVAPGTYTENLTFNNAKLYSIALFGDSQATLQGTISSTTNNTQMTDLNFDGFIINGTGITYSSSGSFLGGTIGAQFQNCGILCPISATLVATLTLDDCVCEGNISLTTVPSFTFLGGQGHIGGNLTLVGSSASYENTSFVGTNVATIDATSTLAVQSSLFTDLSGTITNNGTINAYASYLAGTITNNGTLNLYGSFYTHGNLAVVGTVVTRTPSELIDYDPANTADWNGTSPQNVKNALDRLAAHVGPVP